MQLCSGNVGAALQWLCNGFGTVALPSRPADSSKAGGSGAAAAGWAGPAQLEVVLTCYITYVKTLKRYIYIYTADFLLYAIIYHRYITPLLYDI